MVVEVRAASVIQRLMGGSKVVYAEGGTIAQLLEDLERRYPSLKGHLLGEDGELRHFVNVYLNDEDIRYLGQLDTPLSDGDVVSILPALAGG